MRERHIERKVCEFAKLQGVLVFKSVGSKGVPDRIFHTKGKTWYIEFKAPKGRLSELQNRVHRKLRQQGIDVYVINDIEEGIDVIKRYVA